MNYLAKHGLGAQYRLRIKGDRWRVMEYHDKKISSNSMTESTDMKSSSTSPNDKGDKFHTNNEFNNTTSTINQLYLVFVFLPPWLKTGHVDIHKRVARNERLVIWKKKEKIKLEKLNLTTNTSSNSLLVNSGRNLENSKSNMPSPSQINTGLSPIATTKEVHFHDHSSTTFSRSESCGSNNGSM
jgi:hypothetical protein